MTCQIAYQANARVTRHGLNVFPLQGFGLLLGDSASTGSVRVLVALPVGNTAHWYSQVGRFDRIDAALATATRLFADPDMQPIGLYCSIYWDFRDDTGGETDLASVLATAPRLASLPWLLLAAVDGGEPATRARLWKLDGTNWHEAEWTALRARPTSPAANPRRLNGRWIRAWGELDYTNHYASELALLEARHAAPTDRA